MKKNLFLLVILCFFHTIALAQDRKKEIQARLGWGLGGYRSLTTASYNVLGAQIEESDTSGAAARHLNFDLRYEITRRIAIGLDTKFGSYLYDANEDNTGKSNGYAIFGIRAEFMVVDRPKFRWYLGAGFHTAGLVVEEKNQGAFSVDNKAEYRGGGVKLNTGLIKYFGDSPVGIHFNVGYDAYNLSMESFTVNGDDVDLSNYDGNLELDGVDISLGLIFRIRP